MLTQATRKSLHRLLTKTPLTTNPVELVTYEIDAGMDCGTPDALAVPQTPAEVVRLVRWAREHNVPLVARGAGTGLSGGAVAERGGIVVEFARMNRLIELDAQSRIAMVEPGMVNLVLDGIVKQTGLYFPPDPASQRSATLGGNVAENSGGPHCFKYGVTTNYVTGMDVVLADGRVVRLGGRALDYPEYDLTGLVTGSEGTLGIITALTLRLIRNPPGVKTLMAVFDSVGQAGTAVSAVIAAGLVPATMEMMDNAMIGIVEDFAHAGLPTDAAALLIIEADGYPASLDTQVEEVADVLQAHGARARRIAQTAEERDKIWYARKSVAGAISKLAPAYYLVDITVPRSRLAHTLAQCEEICRRYGLQTGHVFHAGDGNLHPLMLIPDPNDRELIERVLCAAREMVKLGVAADGSISGEHGIGIEKREYMADMYGAVELSAMWDVKEVFDPRNLMNPGKVFPTKMPQTERPRGDAELRGDWFTPSSTEEAARILAALSAQKRSVHIRARKPANSAQSAVGGHPERSEGSAVVVSTAALTGIQRYAPDDLYITVGAGTLRAEIQAFLARDHKQIPIASPYPDATIGGIVASNFNAPVRMRYGGLRDLVLCMTVVLGDGRVIRAGRPVVKNVAGYDLPKVFVGSHGTLGLITDVTLKIVAQPRARKTLVVAVEDWARGFAWGQALARGALVASGIVLCGSRGAGEQRETRAPTRPSPSAPFQLAYTAEGLGEDVRAELEQARRILREAGAPEPVESEAPTATELWAEFLVANSSALQIRAGIPAKDLAPFTPAHSRAPFCADIANGLLYASTAARAADAARAWLDELRRAALELGGYAIVINAPENLRGAQTEGDHKGSPLLDWWGYQPEALDLMRALKARYDPAGILNVGAFSV